MPDSLLGPEQGLPSFEQVLVLMWAPLPQVTLHVPHGSHVNQWDTGHGLPQVSVSVGMPEQGPPISLHVLDLFRPPLPQVTLQGLHSFH